MTSRYYFLHDRLVPADAAHLHVADRGFRFGDGLFDTIRVEGGVPVFWPLHAARLQEGLRALHIPAPAVDLLKASRELMEANGLQNGILRISISRGVGSQGYLPTAITPTLLIETAPLPETSNAPLKLWLSTYEKVSPRALPVHIKLAQGLNATLARLEAQKQQCGEALQINANGEICEATSANIFWFKDGKLFTPALECGVLAGITRTVLLSLMPTLEVQAPLETLEQADGVFISNVSRGLQPCAELEPMGWRWRIPEAFYTLQSAYEAAYAHAMQEQKKQW